MPIQAFEALVANCIVLPFDLEAAGVAAEIWSAVSRRHRQQLGDMRCRPSPRPVGKRIWASVAQETKQVVEDMFLEAESRDLDHQREWVAIVDGNDDQLRLIRAAAKARHANVMIIVDVIHVLEYVWKAGLELHEEATDELEKWVLNRMLQILSGRVSWVASGMRRSATHRQMAPEKRKKIDAAATYLLNKKRYLRYDEYLARGYPVATGVIEGACRHLVNIRMNRSGARWSLTGAEAVLRLRALVQSGDFDAYWTYHEARELERNHLEAYADRRLPHVKRPECRSDGEHLATRHGTSASRRNSFDTCKQQQERLRWGHRIVTQLNPPKKDLDDKEACTRTGCVVCLNLIIRC